MYSSKVRDAARALLAMGMDVSAVSRTLGINRATVRAWRNHPEQMGRHECPQCDGVDLDPSSYASLLGFYLGDGCISAAARYHFLRVSCDATMPGIVAEVDSAILGVRPGGTIHHVRGTGVTVVQSAWKHWPCLIPQDGDGPKFRRSMELLDWQSSIVERHPAKFLRGLFHSDGCRVINTVRAPRTGKAYSYPRWQFSNRSEEIHALCQWALELVDIPWKRSNRWTTSVSKRDAVSKLDELIGLKT